MCGMHVREVCWVNIKEKYLGEEFERYILVYYEEQEYWVSMKGNCSVVFRLDMYEEYIVNI